MKRWVSIRRVEESLGWESRVNLDGDWTRRRAGCDRRQSEGCVGWAGVIDVLETVGAGDFDFDCSVIDLLEGTMRWVGGGS